MNFGQFQVASSQPQQIPHYESDALRKKNLAFAVLGTILLFSFCFIYGFLIRVPAEQINIMSVVTTIGLAILVIVGFGLLFGYTQRLIWSGIGFNFFITAFCIIYYPLINAFWTKTQIEFDNTPLPSFAYADRIYNIVLSNRDVIVTSGNLSFYGNTITNAIKCSLAVAVAFSSILGRAGQLECLFVCLFGTIGFELNRQIIQEQNGADAFGSVIIFVFGGFMGLALGIIAYFREKKEENQLTEESWRKYSGHRDSGVMAMVGTLFVFTLFPFLGYEIDSYLYTNTWSVVSVPVCVILAMGAGAMAGLLLSLIFNGYLISRDITHGAIAGAIVVGVGSLYIIRPAWAIVCGFVGGFIQALIQNLIERKAIDKRAIISTVSWSLFGVQGFLGSVLAIIWKADALAYRTGFAAPVLDNKGKHFMIVQALVSAGMGLAFGLGTGLFVYCTNGQTGSEMFQDGYYWRQYDGIRTFKKKEQSVKEDRPVVPSTPHVVIPDDEGSGGFYEVSDAEEEDVNKHAYL